MQDALAQVLGNSGWAPAVVSTAHLPLAWIVAAAALLGFIVGAVRLAGWTGAYFGATLGGGLVAPGVFAFMRHVGAGQVIVDLPWAAVLLPGLLIAIAVLLLASLIQRAFRLVGLGFLDRIAGAGVGLLAAAGGIVSFSWVTGRVGDVLTMVRL